MTSIICIGETPFNDVADVVIRACHPWIQFKEAMEVTTSDVVIYWNLNDSPWGFIDDDNTVTPVNEVPVHVSDILIRDEYIKLYEELLVKELRRACKDLILV